MRLRAFLPTAALTLLLAGCGTATPAMPDMATLPTTPHHPTQTAAGGHAHPAPHYALLAHTTRIKWYTVPRHGSLSAASKVIYGTARYWPALYDVNRREIGPNPNRVKTGTRLHAPRHPWRYHYTPPTPKYHLTSHTTSTGSTAPSVAGDYTYSQLEQLWVSAGGPAWAETSAATVAECESGGNPNAYNPSGATGLWQILGSVVPGNLYNPTINALNAVSKFTASGNTFAQWVCQP
jgi:Transglycosylase SLT domain